MKEYTLYQTYFNPLFEGIYNEGELCLFCQERCGNDCACLTLDESVTEFNDLYYPMSLREVIMVMRDFMDEISRDSYTCQQRSYLTYSFVKWLSRYEVLHWLLELSEKGTGSFIIELKRIWEEYNESVNVKKILSKTPFIDNLNHIISFLENGGMEIKQAE